MRIIVETALNPGKAEYGNMGDISMLQVAVIRLQKLWPSANIEVFTESPENLAKYCPGTIPLARSGRDLWIGDRYSFLFTRFYKYFPNWIKNSLSSLINVLELRWPALLRSIIRLRVILQNQGKGKIRDDLISFLEAFESAELLVVCGAGGFADSCRGWNWTILKTVELAICHKIPVAMFGQGIGPLNDPVVLTKAKSIFPAVSLFTLRGGRGGGALLMSLGVNPSHIFTTGDEALELAYEATPLEIGQALGVNLRIASNIEEEKMTIEKLRPVLQQFSRRHNVQMVPMPIAVHQWADDCQTIRQLFAGYDDQSDGGIALDTPLKVIKQAGLCRVVVTGAYHAAVFALAQGIPVICLSKSPYYDAKFQGLEDQFGIGCETLYLDDPKVYENLPAALEKAWQSAELVRYPLQQAALRQIELSRSAYEQVRDMLDS